MDTEISNTFIVTPYGDEVLYEVNRDSFDRTGSAALFRQLFGHRFKAEDKLFVIIGTDSGLLPKWIAEKGIPQGSRFLFIELPGIIEDIRARIADILNDDKLVIATPGQWHEQIGHLHFQQYAYIDKLELFNSLGATDAHLPEYREVARTIEQQLVTYRQQVRQQLGNQLFIKRQIENVADNITPAQCLKDSFEGRDAILLGGGPSLDEMIPWIRDNRDELLVIAVSRVSRQLKALDLQPDVVVSVDPQDISFDISKEMLRFPADTLFVHSYHVAPLLLGQWPGASVYTGDKFPWKMPANPENLPSVGPTVTNSALALALHMGCKQIILAGVDLCYSRDGYTHASGSNEHNAGAKLGDVGPQVETNGGWLADTHPTLVQAIDIMGSQAAQALEQGCEVINPAKGAAKIPNITHKPLDGIRLTQSQARAADVIHRQLPAHSKQHRSKALQDTAKELARVNGRLRQVLHLTQDALDCNVRLHGNAVDFKYKKRMDKIERRLDREFSELTRVIKDFAAATFLRLPRTNSEREWSHAELEQWAQRYYETYKNATRLLLDHVEKAQRRVNSRLEEDAELPDFELLFKQWDEDKTPGRATRWLQQHADRLDGLNTEIRDGLQRRARLFSETLDNHDTRQAQIIKDAYTLSPVCSKLLWLFQQADKDGLAKLIAQLADKSGAEAVELLALAEGYLAELNDEAEQAFAHYNRILDQAADKLEATGEHEHNPRLEDALRRMSIIALGKNDSDNALKILDVLSALSPFYEPQYAHLLRLVGRLQDAVNVYTHYLERVPNDLATMLKLGRLYQDAGADESASWAYDYILQQDPGNQAAQQLKQSLLDKPASP